VQPVNGKRITQTVAELKQTKELLIPKELDIVGYAFDGDSCYDRLHREFEDSWRRPSNGKCRGLEVANYIGECCAIIHRESQTSKAPEAAVQQIINRSTSSTREIARSMLKKRITIRTLPVNNCATAAEFSHHDLESTVEMIEHPVVERGK
jgi:hypothetical protein